MNRAGVGKVGAFTVLFGENAPTLLLVLTHTSVDSVVSLRERLAGDAAYMRDGDRAILERGATLLRLAEGLERSRDQLVRSAHVQSSNGTVRLALEAVRSGVRTVVIEQVPIRERDFTGGEATGLWRALAAAATIVGSSEELQALLTGRVAS